MPVPYTFGTATAAIPLSQLDSNFATAITLGNTAVYLGNTTTSLGNVTLTNVTISSGNVTVSNITANAITSPASTSLLLQSAGTTAVTIDTSQNVSIPKGVGGTPALSYYASSSTTLTQGVFTKIGLQTSVFDTTSGMFASSRFTPTVAGYYQINAAICFGTSAIAQQDAIAIYKTGSSYQIGNYLPDTGGLGLRAVVSTIVYCNGSTDYIELYGLYNAGPATQAINAATSQNTWFNACLIRGA